MTENRPRLAQSLYLAAIVVATAGWLWALAEGVSWIIGTTS
jgi:hypothetical protein